MTRNRKGSSKTGAPTVRSEPLAWRVELGVRPGQSKVFLRQSEAGLILGVREQPRDGAANRGVLRALSDMLDVPVSSLSIVRGEGSRTKMVEVFGLGREDGLQRLQDFLNRSLDRSSVGGRKT